MLNRLSTGDRIGSWGSGQRTACVLCGDPEETQNHLFFMCFYSETIWPDLMRNLLARDYSADWNQLVYLLHQQSSDRKFSFCDILFKQRSLMYGERETIADMENPPLQLRLAKIIDKNVCNRLSSIGSLGNQAYENGMKRWLATRPP
ncbi:unnamed protein product [Microthlaspi erraticum]|uniref:Reverse transcriptase zinc-binding domain-containing protein n=1 Tax=Microthlaspi erraticum TaxID=1685480 RepID=A0A6D2IGQ9_9BRAS|nr:unnamed protein product [Microthlaspi erraticum]CAA7029423.1 unnamed protein product [Microthlaspi erraticum]